jgi:hypothetical protein
MEGVYPAHASPDASMALALADSLALVGWDVEDQVLGGTAFAADYRRDHQREPSLPRELSRTHAASCEPISKIKPSMLNNWSVKKLKRIETARAVCTNPTCVVVWHTRATNTMQHSASTAGPCTPTSDNTTTIEAYTGKFSTQFKCARVARRYQSGPLGASAGNAWI